MLNPQSGIFLYFDLHWTRKSFRRAAGLVGRLGRHSHVSATNIPAPRHTYDMNRFLRSLIRAPFLSNSRPPHDIVDTQVIWVPQIGAGDGPQR